MLQLKPQSSLVSQKKKKRSHKGLFISTNDELINPKVEHALHISHKLTRRGENGVIKDNAHLGGTSWSGSNNF